MVEDRNISTEHQPPGDAKRPADTLDRDRSPTEGDSDRGKRAFIAGNGEVRGSGAGAGGGNEGEDYDDDPDAGGGDLTRVKGVNPSEEDRLHQATENQSSVRPEEYPEKGS